MIASHSGQEVGSSSWEEGEKKETDRVEVGGGGKVWYVK